MTDKMQQVIFRCGSKLAQMCLFVALLAGVAGIAPALAKDEIALNLDADRRAKAEAWQVQYEAQLKGGGDLPPISTNADDPPLAVELGGEDVLVESSTLYAIPKLEITTTGVIYLAVTRGPASFSAQVINIYRSDDGGRSFELWSVFEDPSVARIVQVVDFVIAEGFADRAFLAYNFGDAPNRAVRVAWAELSGIDPVWNPVTVFSGPGLDFGESIDLETDSTEYDDYYLYVVATANDADGRDIWFSRSIDQGETWETSYRVVSHTESHLNWNFNPMLSFGGDDYLHLAFQFHLAGNDDNAILTMHAPSAAGGGLAGWSDPTELDTNNDGNHAWVAALTASRTDNHVLLNIVPQPGGTYEGTSLRWSTDAGATWPTDNQVDLGLDTFTAGKIDIDQTSGDVWLLGNQSAEFTDRAVIITRRTNLASLEEVGPAQRWCGQDMVFFGNQFDLEHDTSRGGQRAVAWTIDRSGNYEVYFDAEWHRAPGWPNTEAGFPLALDGIGRTPPALANVDDDPYSEIIFATEEGLIYLVNHDGTVADGWPVDIGTTVPWDAPVAVGDLNGDFAREIVVGDNDGRVHAWHRDGTPLTGWPVDLGTAAATYVSIGALGTTSERQVVVCSGDRLNVVAFDGVIQPTTWGSTLQPMNQSAAIGDVDNDGVNEIVSHQSGWISLHRLGVGVSIASRSFPDDPLRGMPTLVDMDGDGDLEIAVGTTGGKVHLMHHDFADYSASFPYDSGADSAVQGVVPVDLLGTNTPELVFTRYDGLTDIIFENGSTGFGYPNYPSNSDLVFMPPIVANVLGPSPDVVVSAYNALDCWENLGAVPPGWPRQMDNPIEESVAAGDIDLDGNLEIVALGLNQLTVFDVASAPNSAAHRTWPMFGYNAQRTGCLDCREDAFSAVDDPLPASPTRVAFAPPFPNPASSQTALSYALPAAANVKLQIFDLRGRLIRTLADGQKEAGRHEVFWNGKASNGRRVALGMYLAKLAVAGSNGSEQQVRKISLVR